MSWKLSTTSCTARSKTGWPDRTGSAASASAAAPKTRTASRQNFLRQHRHSIPATSTLPPRLDHGDALFGVFVAAQSIDVLLERLFTRAGKQYTHDQIRQRQPLAPAICFEIGPGREFTDVADAQIGNGTIPSGMPSTRFSPSGSRIFTQPIPMPSARAASHRF